MSSDERLDRAADIIAQARAECLKQGVSLQEIAALLLDDAVLALYAQGRSRREASQFLRDFMQRRVPHLVRDPAAARPLTASGLPAAAGRS